MAVSFGIDWGRLPAIIDQRKSGLNALMMLEDERNPHSHAPALNVGHLLCDVLCLSTDTSPHSLSTPLGSGENAFCPVSDTGLARRGTSLPCIASIASLDEK